MLALRITNVKVINSTSIAITLTDLVTTKLITSNISIVSDVNNVTSPDVLSINVSGKTLTVICQPLTSLANYFIVLKSVPQYPFESLNGTSKIFEDGISNKFLITGPLEDDNPVKNYLDSFLQGNIYRNDDDSTVISKYIKSLAINFTRALYDIRQTKNENYLNFNIFDESKVRGNGPFDRLDEESAYEIIRVGRTRTGTNVNAILQFDNFPFYPVTLQKQKNIEILTANSIDAIGVFNINNLIINLSKSPVTKINSIIFTLNTINPVYIYDISKLGYQIKDSRYDQDFGFSYLLLNNNQIKLNDKILSDPLFSLNNIIKVDVQYESKNLGIIIDSSSLSVYTIQDVIREPLPPIINVFNLSHAPIVNSSNVIPDLNGVIFTDPNSNNQIHPAFTQEIPFRLNALPNIPGQYSIDYNSGTVYVFGNDLKNDGTGPIPPLISYKYRFIYQSEIDYIYDQDLKDLIALPKGNLINYTGNILFTYEEVLIPDIDYKSSLHREVLEERIENNLLALNSLRVKNAPITNVFKIFNETSGEIYNLNRWNNDKVYFNYNVPPKILNNSNERVSFNTILNELLFVHSEIINSFSLRIFTIYLNNNTIISSTEDSIASSFNTSANFSNTTTFKYEKWFNPQLDLNANINKLSNVGEYIIDYINGIIYCAVSNSQLFDIGTISYKNNKIVTNLPHIISVNDLYYKIDSSDNKTKIFSYTSFNDKNIIPENLDNSSELFLNKNTASPYQLVNGVIGSFVSSVFVQGVTNQIKFIRSIYEYTDLQNSTHPFNFVNTSTSNGFNISVNNYVKQYFDVIKYDGSNYYVNINENIPYLSANITYTLSIIRSSDLLQLWNSSGTIIPGSTLKLLLPGINSPQAGDQVNITFTININNLSRLVIDYNKGDYYVDYTYLADEIIISYEYGDNILDFRQNTNLPSGTEYFVSYKVGALRDALFKNFATLLDVKELSTFDTDFERERYREALQAGLSSFILGPTTTALKNICKIISHVNPEIIESSFLNWSLGNSLLSSEKIITTGQFKLLPAKFGNGVLINSPEQTIKMPSNSNIRFEEGTFETWLSPQWNGLDNNATLTFKILKDGYSLSKNKIFIGASEFHPTNNIFSLNKDQEVIGIPNFNKDGVYIYYCKDGYDNFNRWHVRVIDGYIIPNISNYTFDIQSTGNFYDNKSITLPSPSNLIITTGINNIKFSITGGGKIDEGITFLSDNLYYLLDLGEDLTKNRLSIFKDNTGYLNFKAINKNKESFILSADVSKWKAGDLHHIAASWKFNTYNKRDEMHLFIDGFEIPNIIKYNNKLKPFLHEKFRTVNPEEVLGLTNRDILASIDLHTISGNNIVTSSINFSIYNIVIGDTIFIDEIGFSSNGYSIIGINGQSLTLNSSMPLTLSNGKFSINRTKFTLTSEINIVPNIAVSTMRSIISGNDISGIINTNIISSTSINFITSGVSPGYLVHINNINLPIVYTVVQVMAHSLIINDNLPVNFSNLMFNVYNTLENELPGKRATRPAYSISKDDNFNNILTISNGVFAGDLILIKTLGLNNKKIKKQYYVWSDYQENILMTRLPSPISLDEVKITKLIVPNISIGPSNSILSGGQFHANNFVIYQPVTSQSGRTISVSISGKNADFSSPITVTINGISGIYTINETLTFNNYGTLNFVNPFISINNISVVVKPINSSKNAINIELKEKFEITHSENSDLVPVIRYSYPMGSGISLFKDGYNSVRDSNFLFSHLDVNNYLVIHSPPSAAGYYIITGLSNDRKSVFLKSTAQSYSMPIPMFTNGIYQIINVNAARSGLQNGFFILETKSLPAEPYLLNSGFYELEYSTYLNIEIEPLNNYMYIGSDINGKNQINGIIDHIKMYSVMLTDTRIGEIIPANQKSITKDFNSLKEIKEDINTTSLINFNKLPFNNIANIYNNRSKYLLSSVVINENFTNSIAILNKPIKIFNNGILDTKNEGTVEFWVSPLYDTYNDPAYRFYFDAFGAVTEEVVSETNSSVKISGVAGKILNVKMKSDQGGTDYFAGGRLEIDTARAIQEQHLSIGNATVLVSKEILQVISVKILGDYTNIDYFNNGIIGSDKKTIILGKVLPQNNMQLLITYQTVENKNITLNNQIIRLNKQLPYHNSTVIVNYIPSGMYGDRLSIFKDKFGYINFSITAGGLDYLIRAPSVWHKNTWHRIKASYKLNGGLGSDEMKMFLDGYEYSNVTFGTELVFGQNPIVLGQSMPGGFILTDGYSIINNIKFRDSINELFIGSQYSGESPIFSLIDNFRISNISRPIYAPFGEPIDINYSTNLSTVWPVTTDLFTTFLSDFNKNRILNDDFTILKNKNTGLFDFSINILDSFGILNSSVKSKVALEALIKVLKPANSRAFIRYI